MKIIIITERQAKNLINSIIVENKKTFNKSYQVKP